MAARTPLQRLLPATVVRELESAARSAEEVNAALVEELDTRLALTGRYGITRRRLRNYLSRVHQAARVNDLEQNASAAARAGGVLVRHRRRQASVAAVLEGMFGHLADCSPDLWDHRAYLMLVGLVYERLALNEQEIPTDELVALAKILAESRRAAVRVDKPPPADQRRGPTSPSADPLPGEFADIVRQVYGTNFQPPGEIGSSESRPTEQRAGSDGVGG